LQLLFHIDLPFYFLFFLPRSKIALRSQKNISTFLFLKMVEKKIIKHICYSFDNFLRLHFFSLFIYFSAVSSSLFTFVTIILGYFLHSFVSWNQLQEISHFSLTSVVPLIKLVLIRFVLMAPNTPQPSTPLSSCNGLVIVEQFELKVLIGDESFVWIQFYSSNSLKYPGLEIRLNSLSKNSHWRVKISRMVARWRVQI
jgi:hypothetical protein